MVMSWQFQLLAKPFGGVTEGPVWDGESIYFTHIPTNRIMKYQPESGRISEAKGGTNHTNGLAHDSKGQLFGCCSGGRAIVRFNPDDTTTVIADVVDGAKLNTPNDLAVDRQGRIWFTNPWNAGNIDPSETELLDNRSVLRSDPQPDGSYTTTRVTFDTTMPNGILVSPDQKTLYVAESNSERIDLDRELSGLPYQRKRQPGPLCNPAYFRSRRQCGASRDRRDVFRCRRQHSRLRRLGTWRAGPHDLRVLSGGQSAGNPPGGGQPPDQLLLWRPRPDHTVRYLHRWAFLSG